MQIFNINFQNCEVALQPHICFPITVRELRSQILVFGLNLGKSAKFGTDVPYDFDFLMALKISITRGAVNRKFLWAGSESILSFFSIIKIWWNLVSGSLDII